MFRSSLEVIGLEALSIVVMFYMDPSILTECENKEVVGSLERYLRLMRGLGKTKRLEFMDEKVGFRSSNAFDCCHD